MTPCGERDPTAAEETIRSESILGPDDEYEDSSESGKGEKKKRNQDDESSYGRRRFSFIGTCWFKHLGTESCGRVITLLVSITVLQTSMDFTDHIL